MGVTRSKRGREGREIEIEGRETEIEGREIERDRDRQREIGERRERD
jgi:hypothetical protein